ncbi:hypothetical protein HNQ80_003633 [Anaerosolibacter carboniphilus]|uniref:Bacteriophage holin of superfamily 6 (Holin_LLH) n=1 Tax=Anaerosolibacter carboniphilus TaxID=1417629 RepID=A0A841L2Z0_9FIRM|nr:hypothetical protein [Anaerosolibacter carboniphilus]MBB6217512.1 hypothetical protein [Anaerosolibacter carboniphilus]
MLELLKENWLSLILLLSGILALWYLCHTNREDRIRRIVLALVIQAEKQLGSGTGELKYAMVVERLYDVLPTVVRWFLSEKTLDRMIEEAVVYLKEYLAQGKNLLGYETEFKNEA